MARTIKNPSLGSPSARSRLSQRREPYWQVLTRGGALGYRKGVNGGSWIARWRDREARQHYQALGPADDANSTSAGELTFAAAQVEARSWFESMGATRGRRSDLTVSKALDDYLAFLKREKAATTAYDTEKRADKHIRPVLGDKLVRLLEREDVAGWRDSLLDSAGDDPDQQRRAKDTANRVLTILKAALNRAFEHGQDVPSDRAWRAVKAFKGVGEARKVFLSPAQCQRLVNVTSDAFRELVIAALATGARYGELTAAKVRDFDAKAGTLHVDGKTGQRDIFLDDDAVGFFRGLAAGREPGAPLLRRDDGEPWGKTHQVRRWNEAAKRAKLPDGATFYSLRHSHASQKLLAGMNHQVLAENMGTSIKMLEKHYGKFMHADRRRLMNQTAMNLNLPESNVASLETGR